MSASYDSEDSPDSAMRGRARGLRRRARLACRVRAVDAFTPEQREEMRRRVLNGETGRAVAARYGVSPATVYRLNRGKR